MSSIYDWSTSSASNANADGDINWAEGQAPSTVNNSARVMMQRVKELLNDLGGSIVAGGSANVITVTAASSFTAYANGLRVRFRAATDNTSSATLNVNAIGAKPLVKITPSGESALSAGEVQEDGIYEAIYSADLNGAAGAWLLINPTAQSNPAGMIAPFAMSTPPTGWLECSGAAVSRTTYATLFSAIGTTWGAGDGSTTFNLPDLRAEFLRGWDHGKGTDAGRAFASPQADELESHTHTATTDSAGDHIHTMPTSDGNGGTVEVRRGNGLGGTLLAPTSTAGAHTHVVTVAATGGTETRPRNVAVMFCVKT
ncbi:tail fiber protein [Sinorhizobium meliloti]|uniref:phage tail protein n=1 Tax=Rhizobium meliloti TaxID=382 RepID=UPI000B5A540E|nr:phage tail protein [Sinorhizobium meliloti]ASJ58997.1 hypothetical protein SMB554_07200 [Sinorhizobium meliloti]MCK3783475.1 tail fiber protein [Sinorhizobium meliloti]MCK3787895.1 tail fiber protein [Sinorhizobium meliloti]MCK3794828.1 tail fiber protein [Sinorhizobium meliloti]UTG98636.1 tail fiber protein [Sinorhizobium meliloti]